MSERGPSRYSKPVAVTRNGPGLDHTVVWLQLVGVCWIVVNQFRDHLGLSLGEQSGLVAKGYLGASIFFMAGGFAVYRRYADAPFGYDRRHLQVLWDRLSSDYPVQVLVLVAMAVGLAGSGVIGAPSHADSFRLSDLPASLFMLQGWGVVSGDRWNFPAWLISADWLALLIFPIIGVAVRSVSPLLVAGCGTLLFVAGFVYFDAQGVLFSDMTSRAGILQAIPAYMVGGALGRLASVWKPEPLVLICVLAPTATWIFVAAAVRASDLWIWPAIAVLVLGMGLAGEAATTPQRILASKMATLAVVLQLTYLSADILYFRLVRAAGAPVDPWITLTGAALFMAAVALLVHRVLQSPLAGWLQQRNPFASG